MLHGREVERMLHQAFYTLEGGTAEPVHLQIPGCGLIAKILTIGQKKKKKVYSCNGKEYNKEFSQIYK